MAETAETNETSDKTEETEESFLNKHLPKIALAILAVGVVLIAFAPYLFTQFSIAYNLADKGPIGDAIGGTTAPIASLLGSLLIFLSLYAQIQANRLVLKGFKKEQKRYKRSEKDRLSDKKNQQQDELFRTFIEMIRNLNNEVDNLSFEGLKGVDALKTLAEREYKNIFSPQFALIYTIIHSLEETINLAKNLDLKKEQKQLIAHLSQITVSKFIIATYKIDKNRDHFLEIMEEQLIQRGENSKFDDLLDWIIEIDRELRTLK